jgi:Zn-dependent protease
VSGESMGHQSVAVIILMIIPIILAVTMHEAAHGYIAKLCGDYTAEQMGRVSLNPIRHIDIIGTIIVPIVIFATTGLIFGWAKPVPLNYNNLKHPRKDTVLVAAAGPFANLIMAIIFAIAHYVNAQFSASDTTKILELLTSYGVLLNIAFMTFNLIPILPLDGGRILQNLLPLSLARSYSKIEFFGLYLVMILAFTGVFSMIINPVIKTVSSFLGINI